MSAQSSLFIGSDPVFPDQDVTLGGSPQVITASLTGMYVAHQTSALSLLDLMENAMSTAGIVTPSAKISESGKVILSADSSFAVIWDDQHLADMLGFSGTTLTTATSHTADTISKYVWMPGRGHTPMESPIGVGGATNYMAKQTVAVGGRTETFLHASTSTTETLRFDVVDQSMFETSSALGGEFTQFFDSVLVSGALFQHYEYVTYNSASSTALTLTGALGPYIMRGGRPTRGFRRNANQPRVEKYYDVTIAMRVQPEYA